MADPNFEEVPDFASAAFRVAREAIMVTDDVDNDEAIQRLADNWHEDHDLRIAEWETQEAARRALAAAQPAPAVPEQRPVGAEPRNDERPEAVENVPRLRADADAEKERQETDKKKPKMGDFTTGLAPPSVLVKRPSQYALNKLSSFEFVELWYFSPEGCNDAAKHFRSSTDDAFGITNTDDFLTLRPVASVKASQNARADHQLTFGEFLQARVSFLFHIKQASWPEKHINAMAMFFWNLESHPHRGTNNGDLIVLSYASRVRRQWHDDLKTNSACDISIINDTLLNNVAWEVNDTMSKRFTNRSVPLSILTQASRSTDHFIIPTTRSTHPPFIAAPNKFPCR